MHETKQGQARYGILRSYRARTEILSQYVQVDAIYRIDAGLVKLVWTDMVGRESILGLRSTGSFLGVPAALLKAASTVGAVTLVTTVVERISIEAFRRLLRCDEGFRVSLLQTLSVEITSLEKSVAALAGVSARQRLENLFSDLASHLGCGLQDGRLDLPLMRREVAALVGITPEHLSRVLGEMETQHIIQRRGQWIILSQELARHKTDTVPRRCK